MTISMARYYENPYVTSILADINQNIFDLLNTTGNREICKSCLVFYKYVISHTSNDVLENSLRVKHFGVNVVFNTLFYESLTSELFKM